ncbi:MAG: type IV pilus biogenesis/stability protein PilW [Cellvibrionaceae bacterium]|nr:type IV pilus biogenesis/stability protein PilW [Cellvibrionaceae bacterium]
MLANLLRFLAVGLLSLFVSACVETRGPAAIVDKDKALEGYLTLGSAYLQRGNRDASRRNFEKALAIDSRSARAHNGMGLLYQLNGEVQLSESSFKRALKLNPAYNQARLNYGAFLYRQTRYREAYHNFETASKDLSFDRRALALTYLGQAAQKLGDRERARSAFEHSLNIDDTLALAKIELAEIYFQDQDYASAKKYLDQYTASHKSSPQSLWLGIRIERIFGNKDKEASYALALRNLHPYSKEYLEYKSLLEQ